MATPVFCCGCECGVIASGAPHWVPSVGVATFSTSTVRSGARSIRVNPSAAGMSASTIALTGSNIWVIRFYVRFASLPSANEFLFLSTTSGSIGVQFKASDSKIYTTNATTMGATGVAVTTGIWYRIDLYINSSANPWTCDAQVDGQGIGQITLATGATSITTFGIGQAASNTCDMFFDDFLMSNTIADYPLGAGKVNHFIPTSDGTHNTGTAGTFITGAAGANITNATTTAFQLIDEVPLDDATPDTNDYINQAANGATNYTEHILGPASGISTPVYAPRAVEAICVYHQAGTGVGTSSIKLNDNGTENSIVDLNAAGVTTNRYSRKHYATPPTGGAWTIVSGAGNFNNLRCRFGYSSDANPDQYFDGIMIEAEFQETIPNKIKNINQAVNRANTY